MGERILREEGFEVVTVTDGDTAVHRLGDVDPDLIVVDAALAKRNGYELCRYVKGNPRHSFARVILTAGALAPFDEELAKNVGGDASLRKPFEASTMLATVRPLIASAEKDRAARTPKTQTEIDPRKIRAAVTLALDAAMPAIIAEVTAKVIESMKE